MSVLCRWGWSQRGSWWTRRNKWILEHDFSSGLLEMFPGGGGRFRGGGQLGFEMWGLRSLTDMRVDGKGQLGGVSGVRNKYQQRSHMGTGWEGLSPQTQGL